MAACIDRHLSVQEETDFAVQKITKDSYMSTFNKLYSFLFNTGNVHPNTDCVDALNGARTKKSMAWFGLLLFKSYLLFQDSAFTVSNACERIV